VVGLRSNDAEVVDLLRRALAPVRRDDVAVFPNVDLLVGTAEGRTRPLHRVAHRGQDVFVTPSLGRAIRVALHHLAALASPSPELLELDGAMLLGPDGAVIVHPHPDPGSLSERQLRRLGCELAGGFPPWLDPSTGEVVVPAAELPTDPQARAELDERFPVEGVEDAGARGGRWPLRAIVLFGRWFGEGPEPSRAAGVAAATDLLWQREQRHVAAAAGLLRAAREAEVLVPATWWSRRELLDFLRDRAVPR
jgi:hypothetical protein